MWHPTCMQEYEGNRMTNEELKIRDLAWQKATEQPTEGWKALLSSFETIYTEMLYDHWKKLNEPEQP